jgi:O-antigen/teichoic acid export membrane protein
MSMKVWLREEVMRRVLRNAGLLGLGKGAGGLIHLATLALSARLLGPEAFGLLILVRSYAQSASGLAKFQSWQTLIRYGAGRAERRDVAGFLDLAAFTIMIDAGSGLIALVVAIAAAQLIGPSLGIGQDAVWMAQLYCLAIPLMSSATPNGVLRIFNRFDQIAIQGIVTPSTRLVGIGIAALMDMPLWCFVLAWLASDVIGELYGWLQGAGELRRRAFVGLRMASPYRALGANAGIVGFALSSNLTATLHQAFTPLLTLLAGGLLGTAAAGVYRIAQVVVEVAAAPAELAMRSLFPEAARLLARDSRHFWRLIGRALALASLLGLAFGLVVILAGPGILTGAMGPGYAGLSQVLGILAVGFVPMLGALPLETALLAMGSAGRLLTIRACSAAVVLAGAVASSSRYGLAGIAASVTAGAFVAFALLATGLVFEKRAARSISA